MGISTVMVHLTTSGPIFWLHQRCMMEATIFLNCLGKCSTNPCLFVLMRTFRKLILLCPSLPAVCSLAKVSKKLWPPFYAHTQLQQKIGKTILVDVLEQVDLSTYVQKMDVKGPDVETMTWIMVCHPCVPSICLLMY